MVKGPEGKRSERKLGGSWSAQGNPVLEGGGGPTPASERNVVNSDKRVSQKSRKKSWLIAHQSPAST